MSIWQSLRIALRALARNKMRTFLTMLGIIIGVAAVIALSALGTGTQQRVAQSFAGLGPNQLNIFPGSPNMRFGGPGGGGGAVGTTTLTLEDAKAIERRAKESIVSLAPTARGQVTVKLGDKTHSGSMTGTSPEYRSVNNQTLQFGRFITESDVDGRLKVAVLGTTVVSALTGNANTNMVGQFVLVNKIAFRVIGVLKTKGTSGGFNDPDDIVIIPITTALRRVLNQTYINGIVVEATSKDKTDLATEQISRVLRQRHHIRPPYTDNDDFQIRNAAAFQEAVQSSMQSMTALLQGIAVISLIVGGIGIMNIMLVSVSERTREIGLRKAVGATNHDLLLQFLIESCVISGVGGLIGVVMGAAGGMAMAKAVGGQAVMTAQSVIMAVIVATAIGLFFGIYPAQKAARLDPIEALRYE
jgi:putative ABC transport system permease protein